MPRRNRFDSASGHIHDNWTELLTESRDTGKIIIYTIIPAERQITKGNETSEYQLTPRAFRAVVASELRTTLQQTTLS